MKIRRRNITNRRRLKKHSHIIRGGTIDDDVKSIIIKLKTYDHNAIADLLEKIKEDEEFKAECRKRDSDFGEIIKTECHYTKNFENFVTEMLNSAILTLRSIRSIRSSSSSSSSSSARAQKAGPLTMENIEKLHKDLNLNDLINAFMRKYIQTKSGPCLSVSGSAVTLQPRSTPLSTPRHAPLSTPRQTPRQGGSRRKRIKRGGEPITIAIVVTGFAFLLYIMVRNHRRVNPSDPSTWGVGSGKHTSVDDLARALTIKELKDKM